MMSYEEAKDVLGPVDDTVVADVVRTGASREELAEALTWIAADDAMMRDGRPRPTGVVAALVDILAVDDEEPEEPGDLGVGADSPLP